MKKQLLFIQGGGEGAYAEDGLLAAYLQNALGDAYQVHYPPMPNENAPEYDAWKAEIAQHLAAANGEIILVGHSLGGSFLLKFLAEETIQQPIAGILIIAAPFWGAEEWEVDEYALPDGFANQLQTIPNLFFYHSRDDEWVPFAHLGRYATTLPQATIREFDGRGHQFNNDLSELVEDIKSL